MIRGGDWYSDARDCRSAFRYADIPEGRFYALGLRVVCELTSRRTISSRSVDVADDGGDDRSRRAE